MWLPDTTTHGHSDLSFGSDTRQSSPNRSHGTSHAGALIYDPGQANIRIQQVAYVDETSLREAKNQRPLQVDLHA